MNGYFRSNSIVSSIKYRVGRHDVKFTKECTNFLTLKLQERISGKIITSKKDTQ